MIFYIIDLFQNYFGTQVPQAFTYTSTRSIFALITALFLTLSFGPMFIRKLYELKVGQPIREEEGFLLSELHKDKKNTPTMGGILILFSLLVSGVFWCSVTSLFFLILVFTTIYLGILGGYDDYLKLREHNSKGLSGKKKLIFQFLLAFIVIGTLYTPMQESSKFTVYETKKIKKNEKTQIKLSSTEYLNRLYIPFYKRPIVIFSGIGVILLWGFLSIVIVGTSNAVNLTDGLDGLAAGLVTMVAGTLSIFAFFSNNMDLASYLNILYVEGSGEVAVYLAALSGASLGFLWYNSPPAEVFMGDVGSLSMGGILGVSAVLLKRELLFGIIGGVFVMEACSVILQVASYQTRKKRIFRCTPIHHHFEYAGWKESKVVIRFWILGILLCLLGLISLKFQ